jgi:predicted DNA-binding transcriptional regulator YafY
MYDPIQRVLTLLEILQARDHVSGSELASRLEVDLRTVQRYIVRLQDLSVPVESVRGVGGHYRLRPGFRLPPLMFTDEEAFALVLGLKALRHLGLSAFAPSTEGAAAKLGRVLPEPLKDSVQTVEEVIALEPGPWVVSISAEFLIRVSTAIRSRRRLAFDYESHSKSASQREIDPYGLAHLDGRWYVAGHCHLRQSMRTFRLDRATNVEIRDESFSAPPDFDIKVYLNKVMPFVESKYQIDVLLDLPIAEVHKRFPFHRINVEEEADGKSRMRCGRDHLDSFAAALLSLGCKIQVIHPPELKQTFADLATQATAASV